MKSTAVFSLVTFILVGTVAAKVAAPAAAPVTQREASPAPVAALLGRSAEYCAPSPNCYCNHVQGEFCGDEAINPYCLNTHVYECNAETGRTCDYGYRDSCAECGQLQC